MKNLLKNKSGFTMVELMVVVIIVGILAAVAIPLYRGNVQKAIATEATATLGSIRTAERIYRSEKDMYTSADAPHYSSATKSWTIMDVEVIDPKYFGGNCYSVATTTDGFLATCESKAPDGGSVPGNTTAQKYFPIGNKITMDQNGTIGGI